MVGTLYLKRECALSISCFHNRMSSNMLKKSTGRGSFHLLCFLFVAKLDKKVYGYESMPDLNSLLYAHRCLQCFSALHHARVYCLLSILTSYSKESIGQWQLQAKINTPSAHGTINMLLTLLKIK